jgi:uncharacterized protein (TIGR00251 family)
MKVTVRVSPGARATSVGGRYGDGQPPVLVVRVKARAVDGKANAAVVAAVAVAFGVAERQVRIVSGHRSRTKVLEIDGGEATTLAHLLETEPGAG